jgi:flagellar biosynthesis protein FlhB
MADTDDSQKTEQPSSRKLTRARSQGQVVQSREINSFVMLGTGAILILMLAPSLVRHMQVTLTRFLDPADLLSSDDVLWEAIRSLLMEIGAALVLPLVLLVAAAVAGSMMQTGIVLATEKVGFDISRLSPLAGFKRLFSMRAVVEFGKNVLKFSVVAGIMGWLMVPEVGRLEGLTGLDAGALASELHRLLMRLAVGMLVVLAALAGFDYVYQRLSFLRSMRMSKQEVKEEHKQAEGDPAVKSRLRQIRMERARKRMMAAVPTASVVVTNPTHFAVALKYEMGSKGAPKVVAKGADLIAQKIREIARENDVPVVENPPLARALYATVELDHEIPTEHYRAVAEIINYVFRLKGKLRPR